METLRSEIVEGYEARLEIHHCGKVYLEAWYEGRFVSRAQVLPKTCLEHSMLTAYGVNKVITGPVMVTPYDELCCEELQDD